MYKKILVPLDGSKLAEIVLPYAGELAGRLNLEAIMLHVCNPEQGEFLPMHQAYVEKAAEIVRHQIEETRHRTNQATARPEGEVPETRGELAVGHPAEEILRYAEENQVDLLLMATHGRSGVKRWALGGVAEKVLRASKIPIWLVPAGVSEEVVHNQRLTRTMLVPLDGSELAESVLPHVEVLSKQQGAETMDIVLLSVCEPTLLPSYYPLAIPLNPEDHAAKCKQANKQYLAKIEKRLKKAGLRVRSEVLMGKPAETIVDCANTTRSNLIVMATHGRSGPSRWVYGSVAEKVLHGVAVPIFLVRPFKPEDDCPV